MFLGKITLNAAKSMNRFGLHYTLTCIPRYLKTVNHEKASW